MAIVPKKKVAPKKTSVAKKQTRKPQQKILAEQMFVNYQMTAKAIAETLDIEEKTIGKWRNEGEWDKKRSEFFASPGKIRQTLLAELQRVATGEAASIDADSLSKITKAIDTLNDKMSPQLVIEMIMMLDNYLADYNPQLANECLEPHKSFIRHIISLYDK